MSGSVLLCALLACGAAPVPQLPPGQAPPPRAVKPDVSLVVIESHQGGVVLRRIRVLSVGFRNGKPLPAEVLWEGGKLESPHIAGGEIRANRYLVSMYGSVIDLREKKLVSEERNGEVVRADDTRVTYWIDSTTRDSGLFAFEYATGTLTRLEKPKEPRIPFRAPRSPDDAKAINWVDGELFLHRDGQNPKSLGKGFTADRPQGVRAISGFSTFPMLWLDDDTILTQRETGKLVTVDLGGKVADVVTIEDCPKDGSVGLIRDRAGAVVYYVGEKNFRIEVAKKTATPMDWGGLGHGFEISWHADADDRYKFRHNDKDIGRCDCYPYEGVSAPGAVAVPTKDKRIAVWFAATGEWTTLDLKWNTGIVGWIK